MGLRVQGGRLREGGGRRIRDVPTQKKIFIPTTYKNYFLPDYLEIPLRRVQI